MVTKMIPRIANNQGYKSVFCIPFSLEHFVHGDLRYKVLVLLWTDQFYRWKRVQNNQKQAVAGQNNVYAHRKVLDWIGITVQSLTLD